MFNVTATRNGLNEDKLCLDLKFFLSGVSASGLRVYSILPRPKISLRFFLTLKKPMHSELISEMSITAKRHISQIIEK